MGIQNTIYDHIEICLRYLTVQGELKTDFYVYVYIIMYIVMQIDQNSENKNAEINK